MVAVTFSISAQNTADGKGGELEAAKYDRVCNATTFSATAYVGNDHSLLFRLGRGSLALNENVSATSLRDVT